MKFVAIAVLAAAALASGQKVKTPKEQEAVVAVFNAQTPDARIAAVENLVTKFKDTEFKAIALEAAAEAAAQKNDQVTAIQYGTRTLDADPKNFQAMLLVSGLLAQTTREFDLDKDEKLGRATKMANDAMTTVAAAAKPNAQLTDEQWEGAKKDMTAQAHDTLGVIAIVDKKYDAAIKEFKTSMEVAATADPTTSLRLAAVYTDSGKYDDSVALLDKLTADPGASDQIKKIAAAEKARAQKLKATKK